MRENVVPFVPLALMRTMQSVMFCAHDVGEHTVTWGGVAKAWMLENPKRGLIRTHNNLISALSDLERVSGKPVGWFTITDNPYA